MSAYKPTEDKEICISFYTLLLYNREFKEVKEGVPKRELANP